MSGPQHIRVGAISAQGAQAPAFRVRTQIPAPELARLGVEIVPFALFSPVLDERFHTAGPIARGRALVAARRGLSRRMTDGLEHCDTTLIQRQVDILPMRGLERQAIGGRRMVLDIDDAIWLDGAPQTGGHRLAFLKRTAGKLRWIAERADHVIAGNDYLAEWLGEVAETVTVVPSLVAPEDVALRRHATSEGVTLGWIGSASTVRYLGELVPVLERLAASTPETHWEFRCVGAPGPHVRGMVCNSMRWSLPAERDLLSRMDIGLMPLPDDAWTRGKCAYKALVYMSAGIPVVADDVGVTAAVVGHEAAGLVARTRGDWAAALAALGRDEALRTTMGREGRRRVEAGYSTRAWAPRIAAILRGTP